MKPEVKERLITGLIQYLNAQSSGNCRFAVADGYLAIDNYFSAILLEEGIEPTRNHKKKLKLMLSHFGDLLEKAEVTQDDLEKFYECWQKARYSSINQAPNKTLDFLHKCRRIINTVMGELANRHCISGKELEEELYSEILGSRWSSFDEAVGYIHEAWQNEAEIRGEMGIGSKLGNKMLNPSNFCEILLLADDEITKEIIAEDSKFGSKIADFYQSFLKLIVYVQNARFIRDVQPAEIPNFMLSLRLRYHGQSMEEIEDDWRQMIIKALRSRKKGSSRKFVGKTQMEIHENN
ncbi:MAG: hypothetical protein KAT34_20940 [Candidatus Aminicenantes bacterium]|nr:hypothetical protein [Candidatus Aminicenantes bacterium]